jgi:hypothetical protein
LLVTEISEIGKILWNLQGDRITGQQPDELAGREENLSSSVDGVEEEDGSREDRLEVRRLALKGVGNGLLGELNVQAQPHSGSGGEEDGSDDERVVVSEAGNQGKSSAESTGGTGNLVEDVDQRIHSTELLDVSSDNVSGDDTADKLNHSVHDTGNTVDGDDGIGVVVSVVSEVVLSVGLVPSLGDNLSTGGSVDNEKNGSAKTEEEDGGRENDLGGVATDEGSDENRSDTLEGLVETSQETDALEGVERTAEIVSVGGEGDDGSVEGLKTELVKHNSENVNGDVLLLGGGEDRP